MNIKRIIRGGFKYLTSPDFRFKYNAAHGGYKDVPDEEFLKRRFMIELGTPLNLDNPQTFNEKLQWLKLHDRKPEYTVMVDKYKVREYIAEKIGEEYLIPLLGVWDRAEDVDFDALPNQFVLKCNHNSGLGMCICKDKSKLDIAKVRRELRKGLEQDYFLPGREWPYKNVPRKIVAEKYMVDSGIDELRDYKFFCFGGVCKCMKVDFDRFIEHRANYFDPQGNLLDLGETVCPPDKSKNIVLPKNMQKMVKLAEKLSEGQPFLRVDFYDVEEQVYFGELTFFPASGLGTFVEDGQDLELGKWIELPQICGGGYICLIGEYVVLLQKADTQGRAQDESLKDYKFFCFNGEPKFLYLSQGLDNHDTARISYLTMDWEFAPFERTDYEAFEVLPPKPKNFEKMKSLASDLSKAAPFLRVDFYEISGRIYFGELTFFPGCGFTEFKPNKWDKLIGDMLELPKIK